MSKPPPVRIKPVFSLISTLLKPDNHKIEIVYNLRRHFLRSIDLSNFWYLAYVFNPLVVIYHLDVIFCQVADYEFQRMHFLKKIRWIFSCSYVLHKKPLPHMLLRTTLQVCCLSKENANNRDHNIMHDLGKSPRFKILYNLNLKNSVTYLKNNTSPIFSIPENDGLQSTDLAHYNPP